MRNVFMEQPYTAILQQSIMHEKCGWIWCVVSIKSTQEKQKNKTDGAGYDLVSNKHSMANLDKPYCTILNKDNFLYQIWEKTTCCQNSNQ